jgi:hypothetical protein
MTKVAGIGTEQIEKIIDTEHRTEQPAVQQQKLPEDSVIAEVKPHITDSAKAMALASGISLQTKNDPTQALSAQGALNEAKVKALLEDDEI